MGQVKGSIFIPWVKGVRGDKSGACDKHLTDEDRKVISGKILASSWYPYDTYRRCVEAVSKEVAKDNLDTIRGWGRAFVDSVYKDIYKNLFSENDPRKAMKSRQMMFKTLYDSITVDLEEISESEYIVTFKGVESDFKSLFAMSIGVMERGLELSGAKGLKAEFIDKSWNGDPQTRIRFSWESWG
ncbi:DUF2378 family protein [Thermodesulfobacteriota bacterium]